MRSACSRGVFVSPRYTEAYWTRSFTCGALPASRARVEGPGGKQDADPSLDDNGGAAAPAGSTLTAFVARLGIRGVTLLRTCGTATGSYYVNSKKVKRRNSEHSRNARRKGATRSTKGPRAIVK